MKNHPHLVKYQVDFVLINFQNLAKKQENVRAHASQFGIGFKKLQKSDFRHFLKTYDQLDKILGNDHICSKH